MPALRFDRHVGRDPLGGTDADLPRLWVWHMIEDTEDQEAIEDWATYLIETGRIYQ